MTSEDYTKEKSNPGQGFWRDDGWFSAPPPAPPSKGKTKKTPLGSAGGHANEENDGHCHSSESDSDN